MQISTLNWEPTPSYSEFFHGVLAVYKQAFQQSQETETSTEDYWNFIRNNCAGVPGFTLVFAIALGLTLLRTILTTKVLQPVARFFQLTPSSQAKLCESLWRFIVYTFTFSWAFFSAVLKRPLFQKPSIMFANFESGAPTPLDMDLLYAFEMGFYIHSIYTLFFVDAWKKDSTIMAFHHVIALSLLSLSYMMNCTTSGVLILLLHDCCDVPLELSKALKYMSVRSGTTIPFMQHVAELFFIFFAVTWFLFRLYFYPLRMIHTVSYTLTSTKLNQVHMIYPSYLMALSLLVMNVYWTLLIIRLIWNVSTGRMAELDDLRDTDVITNLKQQSRTKNQKKKST